MTSWNFPSSRSLQGTRQLLAAVLVLVSTRSSGWVAWSCAGSQQAQGHMSQVDLSVKPQPLAAGQVVLPGMFARNNQNSSLRIFIEYPGHQTLFCESSWSPVGPKHLGEKGGLVQNQGNGRPLFPPALCWKVLSTGCHHTAAGPGSWSLPRSPPLSGSAEGRAQAEVRRWPRDSGRILWQCFHGWCVWPLVC